MKIRLVEGVPRCAFHESDVVYLMAADAGQMLGRAARQLFLSRRFHAITNETTELANVVKGTLFFHAKSKEFLLVMMFQEGPGNRCC
jgi:hypothetical protein